MNRFEANFRNIRELLHWAKFRIDFCAFLFVKSSQQKQDLMHDLLSGQVSVNAIDLEALAS